MSSDQMTHCLNKGTDHPYLTWQQIDMERWQKRSATCLGRNGIGCMLIKNACQYERCIMRQWVGV